MESEVMTADELMDNPRLDIAGFDRDPRNPYHLWKCDHLLRVFNWGPSRPWLKCGQERSRMLRPL